ncbi:MAG: ABC transporter permease [Planctomycetota bacterium]|nr:ABC transporter permease [Planctomycetota bacterium]
MLLPLRYTVRNVLVRQTSALLTMLGIALTVAVFAGVIALRDGFEALYRPRGDESLVIYMRPGATSEGESIIRRSEAEILIKERPEIDRNDKGLPLAAAETFLAVYLEKREGGTLTNVPLRGIQSMSLEILGDNVRLVEGRWLQFGSDEVVVGQPLTERMRNARVGDTINLNITPFKVVGVFEHQGAQGNEVWGDVDRMMEALERPVYQRVIARLRPGTDIGAVAEELRNHSRTPMKVLSEKDYLAAQTPLLRALLSFLAAFLTLIMGASAVLGAMNTMLASVASRTHEIGVLLCLGYSRIAIFLTFLIEAAFIGLIGGSAGILLTLPFDGLETGMTNFNTFTDVSFAFRVTPELIATSFVLAFVLGLIGGTIPAWRAARLTPVNALRTF